MDLSYLNGGFSNEKGVIREGLLLRDAERIAEDLLKEKTENVGQLRKFYDHVIMVRDLLRATGEFERARAKLLELPSLVSASVGRGNCSEGLLIFLKRNVELVKGPRDLENMAKHLQAVVGYIKYHVEKKRKEQGAQNNNQNNGNKFPSQYQKGRRV